MKISIECFYSDSMNKTGLCAQKRGPNITHEMHGKSWDVHAYVLEVINISTLNSTQTQINVSLSNDHIPVINSVQ